MKGGGTPRAWARRLLLGAVIAVLVLQVAYLVAANAILKTRSLDRWVTGATKGLVLKISSGWTLWPGRVHVQGVELHFEDHNVQFSIALDSAVVDLALWKLPSKTFHLTRVRGQGVHYLFRHRVVSARGLEHRLALYPKIAGYGDPPLFEGPSRPPLSDAEYNLWTIQLDDVDVAVDELWFLEYRFTGQARAKGGFRLQPQRDASTKLCSITLDGVLRAGSHTVASKLAGRITAQLDRHDPRLVAGALIFRKISFDIELRADVPSLEVANLYTSTGDMNLSRGGGPLQVRAKLSHGAWQTVTALHYSTKGIRLALEHHSIVGPLALRAEITKPGPDARLQLTAATPSMRVVVTGASKDIEAPRVRHARVVLTYAVNPTRPFRMTALGARLGVEAPELRWLNDRVGSPSLFRSGEASATATLHWQEGRSARSRIAVDTKAAVFMLGGRGVRVSGSADARASYDVDKKLGRVQRFALELPEVAVAYRREWKPFPGGVQLHAERLHWQGLVPRHVQGSFALHTQSIRALVPIAVPSEFLRAMALAVFHLGETRAVIELDRTPAVLELRLAQAQSGRVRATGLLRKESNEPEACGWFYLNSASFNVGFVRQAGSTSVRPFVSNDWWRLRPTTSLVCKPTPS